MAHDEVNVRSAPKLDSEIISVISQNDSYPILEEKSNWIQIELNDGQTGWVMSKLIKKSEEADSDDNSMTTSDPVLKDKRVGTVGVSTLYVRSSASQQAPIIATLKRNYIITITNERNGWYEIDFNGQTGWVGSQYIINENSEPGSTQETIIIHDDTNIRSEPTTTSLIVKRAKNGEVFPISAKKDNWYEITLANGTSAYVASWVVQTSNQAISNMDSGSVQHKTIVIDAGHGGYDSGTIGTQGTLEKSLTLKTAKLLEKKLKDAGANVYMTRDDNFFVSLQSRVAISHQWHADAFISIHFDSFTNSSVRGNTAYYYSTIKDQKLAADIQSEIEKQSSLPSRGVLFGDYFVLRENKQPAALFELGYLSHPQEEAIVSTNDYHERVTEAILSGLEDYFN
ncbi:N-acetylmuramoyl-L-alanine amidase [Bacillus sp. CLL-7-23]|uniref:N-acetylmuramoyl-L-alanine amidase n=1 Tax=Bacillus changyiensis TaxID=3004103 RepID=A0ABT4X6C6_9BACI|nr:N-acetylmuramoyl-L-alanine amidase [Bacillus changyiensis]MDA7027657.1 N-acetylmuramoyl-L-alanine amidase [Bacillus changyiensis]